MRLAALLLLIGCAEPPPLIIVHPDGTQETLEDCAKGCSAPTPDETPLLTEAEFRGALAEVASAPIGVDTVGLDTLLFHFSDLPQLFGKYGDGGLSADKRAWLDREVARQTVDIGFRLVGEDGAILGALQQEIPLKIKQHLVLQGTGALKRVEVSGKTKRVGLQHLWSRW